MIAAIHSCDTRISYEIQNGPWRLSGANWVFAATSCRSPTRELFIWRGITRLQGAPVASGAAMCNWCPTTSGAKRCPRVNACALPSQPLYFFVAMRIRSAGTSECYVRTSASVIKRMMDGEVADSKGQEEHEA